MARRRVDIHGRMFTIVDTGHRELSHAVALSYSIDYCMEDDRGESEDPSALASYSDKVLYTYDSVTTEVLRYGHETGVGCIACYMDTDNKWWVIAETRHSGELVTVFHPGGDAILHMDSVLSNSLA